MTSDKLASAFTLERRSPFLARDLVEFCYRLPVEHKISKLTTGKKILRDAAKALGLPREVWGSRDKLGFASPVPSWPSVARWSPGRPPRSAPPRSLRPLLAGGPKSGNRRGELLLHMRDDMAGIAWPDHWSLPGGGCDPGEAPAAAIVRELDEEASLAVDDLAELFETKDSAGSGQIITSFSDTWNGDEQALPLAEGIKLQFFAPEHLPVLTIPPFIRHGIRRHLTARPRT
ncbi:asparagine synthase-related protein [Streptomyces sp. NBU3104]|uniref:asparagine synthase-related protein n=1 Tax=Streptomyces sp. NBU3104 TaxID=2911367 RepID=UPI001EDB8E67|nr:asparagine synthase-related protein [Streptomyces sp. NBU3104]UKL04212.1 asparagine synthase-related protein [Streptomyces sp. NBU3104]